MSDKLLDFTGKVVQITGGSTGIGRATMPGSRRRRCHSPTSRPPHSTMTKFWLDDPKMRAVVTAQTPLGRPAKPEEMAGMVLFLCSPLASFASGHTFAVDGGQTAH